MNMQDKADEEKLSGLKRFLEDRGLAGQTDSYAYLIAVDAFNRGFGRGWNAGYLEGNDSALSNVRAALGISETIV